MNKQEIQECKGLCQRLKEFGPYCDENDIYRAIEVIEEIIKQELKKITDKEKVRKVE